MTRGFPDAVAADDPENGAGGNAVHASCHPWRTFATQFAVNAGARVIANIDAMAESRMRSYGVAETVVRHQVPVKEAVRQSHPDGIDVLIDLVSDPKMFTSNAALVRPCGTATTTQYVADLEALQASGINGVNFALRPTSELLERVGTALADRTIVAPPITRIGLEDVPGMFRPRARSHTDGKTVIVL